MVLQFFQFKVKGQDILFSHKSDEYVTPSNLWQELDNEFHFGMDAATTINNPLGTPYFYTVKENGLKQDWMNPTYVNPPYSKIMNWVEKASYEADINKNTVVMLLPARTDTKWFHWFVYKRRTVEIRFLKGRLKFENTKYPAPFPSMIVIFHRIIH